MFEAILEEIKNKITPHDAALLAAINPTRARKEGSKVIKDSVRDEIKKDKKLKALYNSILVQLPKKMGGLTIQSHIIMPAALALAKKGNKKITQLQKDTIVKAQKDYWYKDLGVTKGAKETAERVKRKIKKEVTFTGNDINNQQVRFITFYRAAINKILSAKSSKEALSLFFSPGDISSFPQDKLDDYYRKLKTNIKAYTDVDIIEKSKKWVKDLTGKSLDQISEIATQAVFDDEAGYRQAVKAIEKSTASNITARKDIKRTEQRKAGIAVPLLKKEERQKNFKRKDKMEMVQRLAAAGREALDQLLDMKGRTAVSKEKYNELLRKAGLKGTTASALMKRLEKNIDRIKNPERAIAATKQDIKKLVSRVSTGPDEEDVLSWFASMNEEVDLGIDTNNDGKISEYELKNFINRSKDIPSEIAFSATLSAEKKKMADRCFSMMLSRVQDELRGEDSKEARNGKILSIYQDCGMKIWGDDFRFVNSDYLSDKKYTVYMKNGSRPIEIDGNKIEADTPAKAHALFAKYCLSNPGLNLDIRRIDIK